MRRVLWASLALSIGCSTPPEDAGATLGEAADVALSPLAIATVSYPLQFFAERIGGPHVRVSLEAPPEDEPSSWSPSAEAIGVFQAADRILLFGAGFAKWTERVSLPESKTIDTSASFGDLFITIESAMVHSHGPEGEHSHAEIASDTWLDPILAVRQAAAIRDALAAARPEARDEFEERFRAVEAELLALDGRLSKAFAPVAGRPVASAGPSFAYLARRYELELVIVPLGGETVMGADGWHDVEHALEPRSPKWMLWARTPPPEVAGRLHELGVQTIVFDASVRSPSTGDYFTVMAGNVVAVETALSETLGDALE